LIDSGKPRYRPIVSIKSDIRNIKHVPIILYSHQPAKYSIVTSSCRKKYYTIIAQYIVAVLFQRRYNMIGIDSGRGNTTLSSIHVKLFLFGHKNFTYTNNLYKSSVSYYILKALIVKNVIKFISVKRPYLYYTFIVYFQIDHSSF